jgi:hypothetical protein
MPILKNGPQLTLALLFRPGVENMLGTSIHLATQLPERYKQRTVFMTATLHDATPPGGHMQFPVHRFMVDLDERSQNNEPVRQILARRQASVERLLASYGNDDYQVKEKIRAEIAKTPSVWLKFDSAENIVALHDNASLYTNEGLTEPLGKIVQLSIN